MAIADYAIFKWFVYAARWCFWLFRKFNVSDFKVVLIFTAPALLFFIFKILLTFPYIFDALDSLGLIIKHDDFLRYIYLYVIFVLFFNLFYTLRLRRMGIVSVDTEISRGLDYKGALNLVKNELDFIGIGASKLTSQKIEFTNAIERVSRNEGVIRLLLCDPSAPALARLEQLANVSQGQYLLNVKQSFSSLQQLKTRFGTALDIRLYKPETEGELITLRLMFINGNHCLLSQNTFGSQSREGRAIAQLHLQDKRLIGPEPTLYAAFGKLFDQLWSGSNARPITDVDFTTISALQSNNL
jgi:hypothetical protein